jgi:hypothetical protein
MKPRFFWYIVPTILVSLAPWEGCTGTGTGTTPAVADDQVILSNTSGNDNGILVVGQGASPVTYASFTSQTGTFSVGQLTAAKNNNEVAAFTSGRAVAVQTNVGWSGKGDVVNVPLTGPIEIAVTVWVVGGTYQAQHDLAVDMSLSATQIWKDERMGVAFSSFDIRDATANPAAVQDFAGCLAKTSLQVNIGKDANRINVYMFKTVEQKYGHGDACGIGGDFVAIASASGPALLAHEIGHDFGLEHIDDLTGAFDETNVMHSASDTRQFFTEGQLFRAHMTPLSALNRADVYAARAGQPTQACPLAASDEFCPPVARRIWADGPSFPAN